MRESIGPHEHTPPRYKSEPARRSLSISYSGGKRYVCARIIHVKDFYDKTKEHKQKQQAKEQEFFVRVDDHINEPAENSLRRSYSTDYLLENGPRSRIRYIRIPGQTIKIEEKSTYEYKGIMYADLPYSLRYWNILYILDREARQGRPLGSALPQVTVNDPYRQLIPPLTQKEIRQTAQQILSPYYNSNSYTDKTLRWFLSRDDRTEIESNKYLQAINQYRQQKQQYNANIHDSKQKQVVDKRCATEKFVRYEKMPDRLVPASTYNRAQSTDNIRHRSPSNPRLLHRPNLSQQTHVQRSRSQPHRNYRSSVACHISNVQTPQQRVQLPPMHMPLSRHQSVHELYSNSACSYPLSSSSSSHSLYSNRHGRPISFNNRYSSQKQNPLLTEIIDSQTGRHIVTTSQEQLPTEVLTLLNKYNLQKL